MSTSKADLVAELAKLTALVNAYEDPAPVTPPPPPAPTVTPDGPATTVIDKSGIKWTIVNAQIAKNDVVNPVTNNVVSPLYAKSGVCYFKNTSGQWYIPNPDGVSNSTPVSDPTVGTSTGGGTTTPPATTGNGFSDAVGSKIALPAGYKVGSAILWEDFVDAASMAKNFYVGRDDGQPVGGPFNPGSEQGCFIQSQVGFDGKSYMWVSTSKHTPGADGRPEPYMTGCVVSRNGVNVMGEMTIIETKQIVMPGQLNWQSVGGYGTTDGGYPWEFDAYEITGGRALINKHYRDSSGNAAQVGQQGIGPANPADGKEHIWTWVWIPGKIIAYFDGVKSLEYVIPRDSHRYTLTINNAIRNGSNPTIGKTLGTDWIKVSNLVTA